MRKRFNYLNHYVGKIFSAHYNLLLILIVLLFIFRPYERSHFYIGVWQLLLASVIGAAVFNCKHHRVVQIAVTILAVPSVFFSWFNLFFSQGIAVVLIASVTIAFLVICTLSILYDVLRRARVTMEVIRGVICAYFMMAFVFAYMYWLVAYIEPESIYIAHRPPDVLSYTHYLSSMFYFSFVSLLTIGYGDIVAVSDVGQTLCVLEGIIGQFYIAILVARLVTSYSFYSDKRLVEKLEKDLMPNEFNGKD